MTTNDSTAAPVGEQPPAPATPETITQAEMRDKLNAMVAKAEARAANDLSPIISEGLRLEAAATKGKWRSADNHGGYKVVWINKKEMYCTLELKPEDADLIAFARNNFKTLLEALTTAQAEAAELRKHDMHSTSRISMIRK